MLGDKKDILDTEVEDLFAGGDLGDELLEDVAERLAGRGVLCETAGVSGGGDTGGGGDTRVVGEALLDFLVGLRLLRGLLEVDGGGGHGLCGRGGAAVALREKYIRCSIVTPQTAKRDVTITIHPYRRLIPRTWHIRTVT